MDRNRYDVLVVGEGLAGIVAAAASRRQGLRVALVSAGPGSLVFGSGTVNLEGLSGGNTPEQDEALAAFRELTLAAGCSYCGNSSVRAYVPTAMGTFHRASLAPSFVWPRASSSDAFIAVVGIEGMREVNAKFVAEGLNEAAQRLGIFERYKPVTVRLPWNDRKSITPMEIANDLDRDERYWRQLIDVLRTVAPGAASLLVPGMLGMTTTGDQYQHFLQEVGCTAREMPTLPPCVVGWRVFRKLDAQLRKAGVTIVSGFSVDSVSMETPHEFVVGLNTPGRKRSLQADALILATGEPVRDLLSTTGKGRWKRDGSAQVKVDSNLQVLDDHDRTVDNLFVVGGALGDCQPHNGNAFAILTGYQASKVAAEQVSFYAV